MENNNEKSHQSSNFTASEEKLLMDLTKNPKYSILISQKKDQKTVIMQRIDLIQNMRSMQSKYDGRQNYIDSNNTQMSLTADELKKTQDKDILNKDYQQPSRHEQQLMNSKWNSALAVVGEELPTTSKRAQIIQNPAAIKLNNQSKVKRDRIETIVRKIDSTPSSASYGKDSMFNFRMPRTKEEKSDNHGPRPECISQMETIDLTSDSEGDDSSEKSVNIKPEQNVEAAESITLQKEVEKQHCNSMLNINGENQSFVIPTIISSSSSEMEHSNNNNEFMSDRISWRKTQPRKLIKPRQNLEVNELPRQGQDKQKEITTNNTVEEELEAIFGPDVDSNNIEELPQEITRGNSVLATSCDYYSLNRVEEQQKEMATEDSGCNTDEDQAKENPRQDSPVKRVTRRNSVLPTGRDSSFNRVEEQQNSRQDFPAKRVTRRNCVLPTCRDSSSKKVVHQQKDISKQYSGSNTVEDHPKELTKSNSTLESVDEPPTKMAKRVSFLSTCLDRCNSISKKVEEQTNKISVPKETETRPKSILKRTKQNKRIITNRTNKRKPPQTETVTSSHITLQNSNVLESSISSIPCLSIDALRMTKCDNCKKKTEVMGTSDGATPDFFANYQSFKSLMLFTFKVQSPRINPMTFIGGQNENLFYNSFEKMNNLFINKSRQRLHVYDSTKFQDEKPFFALYSQSCKPHFCEASDDKLSIIRESELHKKTNKIKQHSDKQTRLKPTSIYVILYSFDEDLYLDLPQNNFWTRPNTTLRLKKSIDNQFNFIFASRIALANVNIYGSYYAEFVYLGRSLDDEMEKNYDSKPSPLDCGLLHYCKSYGKSESRDEMEWACDTVDKVYLDTMPKISY